MYYQVWITKLAAAVEGLFLISSTILTGCKSASPTNTSDENDGSISAGNPIIKDKYTADPAALVYDGKVYISIPVTTRRHPERKVM